MQELELHAAVSRQIKRTIPHGAIENKCLPVYIIAGAVEIGRAQKVGTGNSGPCGFFSGNFACAVFSPEPVDPCGRFLGKRLERGFRIYGAGTDQDIVAKAFQRVQKAIDIRLIIGGNIHNGIKMIPVKPVSQIMPVPLNQVHAGTLRMGIAVEDVDIEFVRKIPGHPLADKDGPPCYKHFLHIANPPIHGAIIALVSKQVNISGIRPCTAIFTVL